MSNTHTKRVTGRDTNTNRDVEVVDCVPDLRGIYKQLTDCLPLDFMSYSLVFFVV